MIGVDIVEVRRFRKLKPSFFKRVFTPAEIKYCSSKKDPYPHYAARFAAKEAVVKTIGGTINKVEVIKLKNGSVEVKVKGKKANVELSLSHTDDMAIAFCVRRK